MGSNGGLHALSRALHHGYRNVRSCAEAKMRMIRRTATYTFEYILDFPLIRIAHTNAEVLQQRDKCLVPLCGAGVVRLTASNVPHVCRSGDIRTT